MLEKEIIVLVKLQTVALQLSKKMNYKINNLERGWSQVTFLNMETPANQFQDEGEIPDMIRRFAVISQVKVGNFYCRGVS